ncbi:MAG: alpha/beta hydrolase [Thermodesulfobacteriota bacterium]
MNPKNKSRLLVLGIAALGIVLGFWAINTRIFSPTIGARIGRLAVRYYLAPRHAAGASVEVTRAALRNITKLALLPGGTTVTPVSIGGMQAEWVRAKNAPESSKKAILYFHGGGFFSGSPATHRDLAARLSAASGVPALVPDYRLAPEHPFPAANEDCLASYRWLLKKGFRPQDIVIGGDSAGGCLTAMTLLSLRDEKTPLPAAAFLISPLTDAVHFDGESRKTRAAFDPFLSPGATGTHISRYTQNPENPPAILSPVRADLSGLCPLLIQVGTDEILLSDSTRLAERAEKAGVPVTLHVYDHMWHVFQSFAVIVPEARDAIAEIGAFIRKELS